MPRADSRGILVNPGVIEAIPGVIEAILGVIEAIPGVTGHIPGPGSLVQSTLATTINLGLDNQPWPRQSTLAQSTRPGL